MYTGEILESTRLADRPLVASGDETTLDRLLRTMVNESLDDSLRGQGMQPRSTQTYENTCKIAELYFADLLETFSRKESTLDHGARVMVDDDGPVLLQKTKGNRTCLSLRQTTIDGITYPAGCLLGINFCTDYEPHIMTYYACGATTEVRVLPMSQVAAASFLRPSLFALTKQERSPHVKGEWGGLGNKAVLGLINGMVMEQAVDIVASYI
jgi:hypothetical protein